MSQNHLLKLYLALVAILLSILVACTPQESLRTQLTVTRSTESELTTSQVAPSTILQPNPMGSLTRLAVTPVVSRAPHQSTDAATPHPTSSTIPSPTTLPTHLPPVELYIIYSTTSESNRVKNSQIWLFDTLSQVKQLVFSTNPGSTIELNDVRWHPLNRRLLYYIQREADRTWALWRWDLDLAQAERVTEFFPENILGWLADWSIDGQWLSLYTENYSEGNTQFAGLLVESETGKVIINEQIGEWSPVISNQFVYYSSLATNPSRLLIKSTGSDEPIRSIDLDFTPVVLAWQPSGENLVATSDGGASGNSNLYSYNFTEGSWFALQEPERNNYSPILSWSPSSTWLAISYPEHIYILNESQLTKDPMVLAEMERPFVETWLEQPDRMIIRSKNALWLLDPSLPDEMRQVFNLQILGLTSASSIDIWGP